MYVSMYELQVSVLKSFILTVVSHYRIFCRSFCIDWSRCIEKKSFVGIVPKFSKKLKLNNEDQRKYNEENLAALKDVLFKYYETIANMFNYVAANSGFMGGIYHAVHTIQGKEKGGQFRRIEVDVLLITIFSPWSIHKRLYDRS